MAVPIEVEHLTRSYGAQRGIVDVSFTVREGEIFAFLGPNGAGKTTTIRTLMGLLRPTEGSARIFAIDCWTGSARAKAQVGFIPGEMHLYEGLTGRELLDHFASFRKRTDPRRRHDLLERLELDTSLRIRHMSKGNRQKLGVVQALMLDAPLLILDEPSSGLDPLKQVAFLDLLREERAKGRTVFLSSHAIPEVQRVADRVAIVREGRLVAVEEVSGLIAKSSRHAHVTFTAPVDSAQFAGLDAIHVISASDDRHSYELGVPGDIKPLLRRLVELPLEDLAIETDDLETVFLRYYAGRAAS